MLLTARAPWAIAGTIRPANARVEAPTSVGGAPAARVRRARGWRRTAHARGGVKPRVSAEKSQWTVIFESFSCISLDSIMDSIDSSQIPLLIGRGRRRRVEGAEEHPPRQLLPGWGSWGRAFNSGLASQMDRSRDADADRCAVGGEPVILSATSPHDSSLRHSLSQLPGDALPPLSPRCRAQQAVRSGRCAFRLSVFSPARVAVWFWLFAGQGAEMEELAAKTTIAMVQV